MFISSILLLTRTAVEFVAYKFPKEFYEPRHASTVFDLTSLVADELEQKNSGLFVDYGLKELVNIKDVNFGDKTNFELDLNNKND